MSSPTPTPGSRVLASNALRRAGLIDKDTQMRDVSGDRPGGRKHSSKIRSHRATLASSYKDALSSGRQMLGRMNIDASGSSDAGSSSNPLSIRGASTLNTVRRLRKNAVSGGSTPSTTANSSRSNKVHYWRELVKKRWNPEMQLLNLSSLIDDPLVKKHDLTTPGYGGTGKEAAVLFKLAAELKPEVKSLDLSNNNLTGTILLTLGQYLPRLANLSLQKNKFRLKDLDLFARKGKMLHLKELIILENPVRDEEFQQGQSPKYRPAIIRRFPQLTMLDMEPITAIQFDSSSSTAPVNKPSSRTFPFEMGPSFIAGVDPALISTFLPRFFAAFDTQRQDLVHVYHPTATFSFSANTSIPERARVQGLHNSLPNQKKLTWTPWLRQDDLRCSRNLSRILNFLDKQQHSLLIGGPAIVETILTLPATKHNIGGPPEEFCLDCYPVPFGEQMALLVVVHGQFMEMPTQGLRSFDRTFVLSPAPDGSAAKLNGWPVQIVSDQWTVRAYSHHDAWKPGPMLVQAADPNQSILALPQQELAPVTPLQLPPDQQAMLLELPEPQRSQVRDVCARTKLNVKFAYDCLNQNGWDLTKAIINFHEVKHTLPPTAFLQQ